MRVGFVLLILALMPMLGGCRTFDVHHDWDPDYVYTALNRFMLVDPPKREYANPFADNALLRKRITAALDSVLTERGFTRVEDRADFLVTYEVLLEDRLRVDGVSSSIGTGFGRYARVVGSVHSSATIRSYQEATLIVDVLDPVSRNLVWRGWGTGMLRTRDRDRGNERLKEGVSQILEGFPPGRRSGEKD